MKIGKEGFNLRVETGDTESEPAIDFSTTVSFRFPVT